MRRTFLGYRTLFNDSGEHDFGDHFIEENLIENNYLVMQQNNFAPTLTNLYPDQRIAQVPANKILFEKNGAPLIIFWQSLDIIG